MPEGRFGLATLGEIAGNLRISEEFAVLVADRIDDDVRPEGRTILPNSPALRLEFSFGRRSLKRALRQICRTILISIKLREILAEDFRGRISLEPFQLITCPPGSII